MNQDATEHRTVSEWWRCRRENSTDLTSPCCTCEDATDHEHIRTTVITRTEILDD